MRYCLHLLFVFFAVACSENDTSIDFPKGGYAYPKQVSHEDSELYFYPVKDALSSRDSFRWAFYQTAICKSFEEPNLSLAPPEQPIFRLIWEGGYDGYASVLTMTQDEIALKEVKNGYATPVEGEGKLDSVEYSHFSFFEQYFPAQEFRDEKRPWREHYRDLMILAHPQLTRPTYYHYLQTKVSDWGKDKFTYRKWTIPISKSKFRYFVNQINESGYCKFKPTVDNCLGTQATDADGVTLEAALPSQYNIVSYTECSGDTSKLTKVCYELITFSGLDKSRKRWEDSLTKKHFHR